MPQPASRQAKGRSVSEDVATSIAIGVAVVLVIFLRAAFARVGVRIARVGEQATAASGECECGGYSVELSIARGELQQPGLQDWANDSSAAQRCVGSRIEIDEECASAGRASGSGLAWVSVSVDMVSLKSFSSVDGENDCVESWSKQWLWKNRSQNFSLTFKALRCASWSKS